MIYRYGYRAARLVWWFTKPVTQGAVVMLWHKGRVLLVRASYREAWMAPARGIRTREAPVQAAVREIAEVDEKPHIQALERAQGPAVHWCTGRRCH